MADIVNIELIAQSLKTVRKLRSSVGQVFQNLNDGVKSEDGNAAKDKYVLDMQTLLVTITSLVSDLEKLASSMATPSLTSGMLSLSNSGLLSQDPVLDKTSLYQQLLQSYKWADKFHEYANHVSLILNANPLKRSSLSYCVNVKRMRKVQHSSHAVSSQIVDSLTSSTDRLFPDMNVTVTRPMGNSAILQITLGRTLRVLVALRSLIIEWVVVKAFNEHLYLEDGKIDLWSKSRYEIFQKVSDHANAALLHFYSPLIPELAVKSFMTWLHSYSTLFAVPCHRCGMHLHGNMPPTWRDFRTLDAYHENCKP